MLKRKRVNSNTGYTVVNISIHHKEMIKEFSRISGCTIASIVETAVEEFVSKHLDDYEDLEESEFDND